MSTLEYDRFNRPIYSKEYVFDKIQEYCRSKEIHYLSHEYYHHMTSAEIAIETGEGRFKVMVKIS